MADQSKSSDLPTYAGQVSHDLNNLLTIIIGHADLLAESLPTDGSSRSSADEILEAALRAQQLSNELLQAARAARQSSVAPNSAETAPGSIAGTR